MFCGFSALADAGQLSLEYKVKAAYLFNFTKFISWPQKSGENFNICILGHNPFNGHLKPLENRSAQGKPIRLYYFQSFKQALNCHILYLDSANSHQLTLTESPVSGALTVSSQRAFASSGGMIGFILREGRIKLRINLSALQKKGLKISAKLLEVAEVVEGDDHE